jgi:hypothetical protein
LCKAPATGEHFLSHAYREWQTWAQETRRQFTNILYMLNRAPSYEWDWEHFIMEYTVFDACYKVATEDLGLVTKVAGHAKRIDGLCAAFHIWGEMPIFQTRRGAGVPDYDMCPQEPL